VDKINDKWGHSQENFWQNLQRGVDASFPQDVRKLLLFRLYKTTVIHKLSSAVCEAKLSFVN
jgi:hypothetical protein